MQSHGKYLILLHVVVFIFGFTGILGELIQLPSTHIVSYRMAIAVLCLAVFALIRRKASTIPLKESGAVLATGILIAIHWVLFFEAIKVSTVSVTLAVLSSATLFTALLEPLIYKKRIVGYELILGAIVITGLFIIFRFETRYTLGIIYTLISACAASLFTVINGGFARKYDPVQISLLELSGGGIAITLYVLISTGNLLPPGPVPFDSWIYLLVLGTICTAFAYVASVKVMQLLTPFTVTMTINLEPVYGIILALVLLGDDEYLSPGFYAGALVIIAAVFLNGWLKTRDQPNIKTGL